MTTKAHLVMLDGDWVSRPPWWRIDRRLSNWWHGRNVLPKNTDTLVNHPAYRGTVEKVLED